MTGVLNAANLAVFIAPPCNLLDFKVSPNLDGFPIRGAKGGQISPPFGRGRFAHSSKIGEQNKNPVPTNWHRAKKNRPSAANTETVEDAQKYQVAKQGTLMPFHCTTAGPGCQ